MLTGIPAVVLGGRSVCGRGAHSWASRTHSQFTTALPRRPRRIPANYQHLRAETKLVKEIWNKKMDLEMREVRSKLRSSRRASNQLAFGTCLPPGAAPRVGRRTPLLSRPRPQLGKYALFMAELYGMFVVGEVVGRGSIFEYDFLPPGEK